MPRTVLPRTVLSGTTLPRTTLPRTTSPRPSVPVRRRAFARRLGALPAGALALLLLAGLGLTACAPDPDDALPVEGDGGEGEAAAPAPSALPEAEGRSGEGFAFANPIEKSHRKDLWDRHEALAASFELGFGPGEPSTGEMLFRLDTSKVRLTWNGGVAVWDGADAWVAPGEPFPRARFHLLTWPYFLAAPMKLQDPGSSLEPVGLQPLRDGESFPAARLTFEPGVGDTPDDWYLAYRDPETDRLLAMAYIVTYGKDQATAEAAPHCIVYGDYRDVDGVAIAHSWTFWDWREGEGIVSEEPIGRATLRDVRFVRPEAGAFEPPAGAEREELPEVPAPAPEADAVEGEES